MRWLILLLLFLLPACKERDPWEGHPDLPNKISFNRDIRPILSQHCLSCHGPEQQLGGLRLDRSSQLASITTDNSPKKSLLWEKIQANHPAGLPDLQKALLWRWIKQGLPHEGHWASLPISSKPISTRINPHSPATSDDLLVFSRALFGREYSSEENQELLATQPTCDQLLNDLMATEEFSNALETRLLLLSGIRPPAPHSPFAPYLRWLDHHITQPDLALDEFFIKSIAGDLIPEAGQEGTIATAWLRMPRTGKNRPLPHTLARTFLALDLLEAQPALWPDAPSVMAQFFPETLPAQNGSFAVPPFLPIHTPVQITSLKEFLETEKILRNNLSLAKQDIPAEFAEWLASEQPATPIPDLVASFVFDEENPADTSPAGEAKISELPTLVPGINGQAVTAPCDINDFPISAGSPFTLSFYLRVPSIPHEPTPVLASSAEGDPPLGLRFALSSSGMTLGLYGGAANHAIAVASSSLPTPNEWHHYAISYDGSRDATGLRLLVDSRELELHIIRNGLFGPPTATDLHFRFPEPTAALEELYLHRRVLLPLEIAHLRDGSALPQAVNDEFPNESLLLYYYQSSMNPTVRTFTTDLARISEAILALQRSALKVPIAPAWPDIEPRPTLPFTPLSVEAGANRLGFAQWLFSAQNPVTARVLANRLYLSIHGVSLIPNPNNIADPWKVPIEPALLDALANELLQNDWNIRHILKLILLTPPADTAI